MTVENNAEIVRRPYKIAEDQDLEGWVAAFAGDGTFTGQSIGVILTQLGVIANLIAALEA